MEEETQRLIGGIILNTRIANVETLKVPGDATIVTSITLSTKIANVAIKKTTGVAITATWMWQDTKTVNVEINNDFSSDLRLYF